MDISEEAGNQRNKFDIAFRKLMEQAPAGLYDRWDKLIIWTDNVPHPYIQEDILRDLSSDQYDQYLFILSKFRTGQL